MNVKKRIAKIAKNFFVKFIIFLGFTLGCRLEPKGSGVIDRFCLSFLLLFLIFLDFGKINVYRHKGTIFIQHTAKLVFVQIFLFFRGNMHNDRGAVRSFRGGLHFILSDVRTSPVNGGRTGIRFRDDLNGITDHECGVKAETKVTDDTIGRIVLSLVFLNEFKGTGKSDLTNIARKFIFGHTDSIVFDRDRFCLLIKNDVNAISIVGSRNLSQRLKSLEFGNCVGGV